MVFSNRTIYEHVLGWTRNHHLPKTSYKLVGPLLHVHFPQPLKGTTNDFFFLTESTPDQVPQVIESIQPNLYHWLTVYCSEGRSRELAKVYERLGYHFKNQEPVMMKRLTSEKEVTRSTSFDHSLERTFLRDTASWAQAFSQGVAASPAAFLEVVHWHYTLVSDGHQVAKGSWIMTPDHLAYIDDIETMVAYRRRGFAETLMQRMLSDAAAAGAVGSVLSASPLGKPLYQKLGYDEQAALLVLVKPEEEFL